MDGGCLEDGQRESRPDDRRHNRAPRNSFTIDSNSLDPGLTLGLRLRGTVYHVNGVNSSKGYVTQRNQDEEHGDKGKACGWRIQYGY